MTELDRNVLDCIRNLHAANGFSPSISEIMDALGYRSKNSIHKAVTRLLASGHLVRTPGRHRNVVPADTAKDLSGVPTAALRAELKRREKPHG